MGSSAKRAKRAKQRERERMHSFGLSVNHRIHYTSAWDGFHRGEHGTAQRGAWFRTGNAAERMYHIHNLERFTMSVLGGGAGDYFAAAADIPLWGLGAAPWPFFFGLEPVLLPL